MRLPIVRAFFAVATLGRSGCATVTGEATQAINIQTVDAQGKAVDGMKCRIVNGSAEYMGDTPLFGLSVRKIADAAGGRVPAHRLSDDARTDYSRADLTSGSTAQLLPVVAAR